MDQPEMFQKSQNSVLSLTETKVLLLNLFISSKKLWFTFSFDLIVKYYVQYKKSFIQ